MQKPLVPYDCSKGAIRMLTRALAVKLAPLRVNVNGLAPGLALTPFNQAAIDDPKLLDEQVQSIPWKRAAEPAEIVRLAVFLASQTPTSSRARRTSWTADSCATSAKAREDGLTRTGSSPQQIT